MRVGHARLSNGERGGHVSRERGTASLCKAVRSECAFGDHDFQLTFTAALAESQENRK